MTSILKAAAVLALLASCAAESKSGETPAPSAKTQPSANDSKSEPVAKRLSIQLVLASDTVPFTPPDTSYRDAMMGSAADRPSAHPTNVQAIGASLRVTNTTDSPLVFAKDGDGTMLRLTLEGDGAWNGQNPVPCPEIFMPPVPQTLAPGASFDLPVPTLLSGDRCDIHLSQASKAGTYTLAAHFTTEIAGNELAIGKGIRAQLTAPPVRITFAP